ncbi:MAG: T9SS type A sorting domain-containing protein [Chitinophagales bacterium]
MKHVKIPVCLFLMLLFANAYPQLTLNCSNDSLGLIPLTDLGTGFYGSIMGGLYPGGSNTRPFLHEQKGIEISQTIEPLDTTGAVNYEQGKILLIGMGGSNASNAYNIFTDTMQTHDWAGTNPCMKANGLFFGGKDLHDMIDTTSTFYWDELQDRLFSRDDSWEQIQVVWMLEQSEFNTEVVEDYVDYVAEQYITLMHRMIDTMPNLKIVYLTGFHYTGYTHPNHELYNYLVEPKGYWGNLAIKELIERQINGDPELIFEGPGRVAPFISWGPYFWADGNNPRGGDFLVWPCEDYRDDDTGGGFHLEETGKYKEAKMIMNFFDTDTIANWWYKDDPRWAACTNTGMRNSNDHNIYNDPAETAINIYPQHSKDKLTIEIPIELEGDLDCAIFNVNGEKIFEDEAHTDISYIYQLNISNYPEGVYAFVINSDAGVRKGSFMIE